MYANHLLSTHWRFKCRLSKWFTLLLQQAALPHVLHILWMHFQWHLASPPAYLSLDPWYVIHNSLTDNHCLCLCFVAYEKKQSRCHICLRCCQAQMCCCGFIFSFELRLWYRSAQLTRTSVSNYTSAYLQLSSDPLAPHPSHTHT